MIKIKIKNMKSKKKHKKVPCWSLGIPHVSKRFPSFQALSLPLLYPNCIYPNK